jgi:hypothetical protein
VVVEFLVQDQKFMDSSLIKRLKVLARKSALSYKAKEEYFNFRGFIF